MLLVRLGGAVVTAHLRVRLSECAAFTILSLDATAKDRGIGYENLAHGAIITATAEQLRGLRDDDFSTALLGGCDFDNPGAVASAAAGARKAIDRVLARACNVCGTDRGRAGCTNGRCARCHTERCTTGGDTSPGHGMGRAVSS